MHRRWPKRMRRGTGGLMIVFSPGSKTKAAK
jgi:hypothetical protein